jgi:hypothetical protein
MKINEDEDKPEKWRKKERAFLWHKWKTGELNWNVLSFLEENKIKFSLFFCLKQRGREEEGLDDHLCLFFSSSRDHQHHWCPSMAIAVSAC